MGNIDVEGKQYLSNPVIFADAFNYLLYGGEQVICPDELQELDTTELTVPYGNSARVPVQKYRDLLKLWNAMMDDKAIYVILGAELQDKVHYGMPVKDGLYDMLGYSKQIAEIKRSYKNEIQKEKDVETGEITVEKGVLKIRFTSEEFLSGLRKGDKLIPIITAVIYLGDQPWDGPMSLYEMLDIPDESLKKYIPNYWINLISPADMEEEEFKTFHSELGYALRLIKHQSEDANKIISQEEYCRVGQDTACFLNAAMNLKLEFEEKTGGVNMCLAFDRAYKEKEVTGAIGVYREYGESDEFIIDRIMKRFNVSREYVLALLTPQANAK